MEPSIPMTLEAIVFDFNGTLANDLEVHVEAYWQAGVKMGYPTTREMVLRHISVPPSQKRVLYYGDISDKEWKEVFDLKQRLYGGIMADREVLFPDTLPVVRRLSKRFSLGLVSNTFRKLYLRYCPDELSRLFAAISFFDEEPVPKPAPDPLLKVMKIMGVTRDRCCYVGDSLTDVKMAGAAGVTMYGVSTGEHGPDELLGKGAALVAPSLTDLEKKVFA